MRGLHNHTDNSANNTHTIAVAHASRLEEQHALLPSAPLAPRAAAADDDDADSCAKDFADGDDDDVRWHWALLVAGSNGWGNYRHQADVLHAYHVLRGGGLCASRIVTMVYDDLAGDADNWAPGQVFNSPGSFFCVGGVYLLAVVSREQQRSRRTTQTT